MKISHLQKLKKEIRGHKLVYILFFVLLSIALYFRVWRTGEILHFFYDQGRDALVIWDFLKKGDFFLIGPTTGIAGIFRGPYYYYLIAPFYLLGGGNPVFPAVFLAVLSCLAIIVLFYLAKQFSGYTASLIAVLLASFSFYVVYASRWLSNPTPMLFLSTVFILSFYLIMKGMESAWILLSLVFGLSLFHFGSSGEFFYLLAIIAFVIWQRKFFPRPKTVFLSILAFGITAAPLILFDVRNNFLLTGNVLDFVFAEESFRPGFLQVLQERVDFYNSVFWSKIFPSQNNNTLYIVYVFWLMFALFSKKILKSEWIRLLAIVLLSPMVGLLFFQGNQGNIYDYYMTGYYLIWILFLALVLAVFWKTVVGKIYVFLFLFVFVSNNFTLTNNFINDKVDGSTTIAFGPQKESIEWVYQDAEGEFNIDVYVPPVIPYAYDYLFKWYESMPEYDGLVEEIRDTLYTIYEVDPPHPERLEAWLKRQKGIGEVIYEETFAGITVQKRRRIQSPERL